MRSRRNSFAAALLAAVMLVSASSPAIGGADTNVSVFRSGAVQPVSAKEDDAPPVNDLPESVDNSGKAISSEAASDSLSTTEEGTEADNNGAVKAAAQTEQTAAQAEQTAAQTEQTAAQADQTAVQTEQTTAQTEQTAAQAEQTAAQADQTAAQTEQTTAQTEQTTAQTEQTAAQDDQGVVAYAEQESDDSDEQNKTDNNGQEKIEIRRMYNPVMECDTTTEVYVDPTGNIIDEGIIPIESDEALEEQGVTVVRNMSDYYEAAGIDPAKDTPRGSLPVSVDNSKSEYFPKVTSQWGGSCMIYASVYYQFTYTYNKLNQIATDYDTLFSPRFTYNIHNMTDSNNGTWPIQCYEEYLKKIGAVTMPYAPFGTEGNDVSSLYYTNVFPEERVYRFAASHKIKSYYEYAQLGDDNTKITSNSDSDLTPVKTALANGELLTFYTYHSSIASVKLKENPSNPSLNAGEVGKECMIYCYGYEGCHEMTIVGYNDNIWVDLNNNGQIDAAEMGAFKIVNSHGTGSHNQGFCWVSYDALNKTSAVSGAYNHEKRHNIFYCIVGITMQPADYPAHAFIKYTMNTDDRFDVYCTVTGKANGKTATSRIDPYVNRPEDGKEVYVSLTGTDTPEDGTLVWDILPLMEELGISDYTQADWTVTFEHKKNNGHNAIIKDCCLYDDQNYRFYQPEGVFPFTVQNSSRTISIPKTYHNYAVVYYHGYEEPTIDYTIGNYGSTTSKSVKMTHNFDKPTYTYWTNVDLGSYTSATASIGNSTGRDNNNGSFYRLTPGVNYIRTTSAIAPLKINYRTPLGETADLGCNLKVYANATGGCGPYRYRYSITNSVTGEKVFSTQYDHRVKNVEICLSYSQTEYVINEKPMYEFTDEGTYKVTVEVMDVEGRTGTVSFNQKIKDMPFQITKFYFVNPKSVYTAGEEMVFHFNTENDKYTPGSFFTYIHFYKDGKFLERKLCYPTTGGTGDYPSKVQDNDVFWTPPMAGNYRAIIIRADNNNEYDSKILDFKVTGAPVTMSGTSVSPSANVYGGTALTLTAGAVGGTGKYTYKYSYFHNGIETVLKDYSDETTYNFSAPGEAGTYRICIRAKDENGAGAEFFKDIKVNSTYIRDITVPSSGVFSGQENSIGLSGNMASDLSEKNISFYAEINGSAEDSSVTISNSTIKWTPKSTGTYKVTVSITCGKMVIARKTKEITVKQGFVNPEPNPDKYKITVAVISYIENEGQQNNYRLHYWNNNNFYGDVTLTNTGRTISASVGSGYWGGANQTFKVYEAYIPKASTGYKFHINDRWFGSDGNIASTKGVYIFNYSGDKALYANIT